MTYQEQKALPDDMFAVVVTVKNKVTGEPRKIRMFPINDEAHVRNALARLGQPAPQATLKKLGVNIESVRKKILKRAKELKMTQLLERYKSASDLSDIEKSDVKILEQIEAEEKAEAEKKANEEFAKITKDNENLKKEIELSKTEIENLKKVIEAKDAEIKKISEDKVKEIEKVRSDVQKVTARRIKLGEDKAKSMTDEEILNEDKFKGAILELENASLKEKIKSIEEVPTGYNEESSTSTGENCMEIAKRYINKLAYGSAE